MLAAAAVLLAILAAICAPHPTREPGVATRDFEAYWSAGRTALEGGSPYARDDLWARERRVPGVDASRDELLPFVSPPVVLPLFEALAHLPYETARKLWLALLVAACALGAWASFAMAGFRRRDALIAALATLGFSPLTATLGLGQLAGLSFGVLALGVLLIGRPYGGIALACSAVQPNLAVAALGGLRRTTTAAYAIAGLSVITAAAVSFARFGGVPAYLAMVARHGSAELGDAIQFSLPALLAPFAQGATLPLRALALAFGVAVTVVVAPRLSAQASVAFACAVSPFAMPFFHHQDLIVALMPAAFALAAWQRTGAVLGALGTAFVAIDWLDLAQQPQAQPEDLLLGAAAACAIAALRPSPQAVWLILPTTVALALAPVAAAHPVPLWPFALPPHFHISAQLDAAGTWAREQEAAGLTQAQPLWMTLRALPLLGCALLAVAIARDRPRSRTLRQDRV